MTEQEMMKEALEWQGHIRKLITATDDELYHKRSKVFDWLLEQAEKREYWMKQHRKRANELEDAYFKIQLIEKQLQQAQAKAERYKQALEHFANLGTNHDANPTLVMDGNEVFMLLDYIKSMDEYVRYKARKALEGEE